MDSLFNGVGAKLKAFAKGYFQISFWVLVIGGIGAFLALIVEEYTAAYAFGVLIGVPLMVLSNLIACWVLYAFGTIAERHETEQKGGVDGPYVAVKPYPTTVVHTPAVPTVTPKAASASASFENGWKCRSCSRVNPKYQTTCACGAKKPH